jgi:hypothetical protein
VSYQAGNAKHDSACYAKRQAVLCEITPKMGGRPPLRTGMPPRANPVQTVAHKRTTHCDLQSTWPTTRHDVLGFLSVFCLFMLPVTFELRSCVRIVVRGSACQSLHSPVPTRTCTRADELASMTCHTMNLTCNWMHP